MQCFINEKYLHQGSELAKLSFTISISYLTESSSKRQLSVYALPNTDLEGPIESRFEHSNRFVKRRNKIKFSRKYFNILHAHKKQLRLALMAQHAFQIATMQRSMHKKENKLD